MLPFIVGFALGGVCGLLLAAVLRANDGGNKETTSSTHEGEGIEDEVLIAEDTGIVLRKEWPWQTLEAKVIVKDDDDG